VKRVLTARFMHGTNTFSRVPTDMAAFRRRDFHLENEIPAAFRGTRSAPGATFEAADKFGWTLVHPVSANPNPSGIVTDEAFETVTGMILDAVDAKGPIDGALLHLHGAMVSERHEDAEGELLARLRRRLGPEVRIVVTLDLHANVTRHMADNASALIAYRTYPHIDYYERAWQGACEGFRTTAPVPSRTVAMGRRPKARDSTVARVSCPSFASLKPQACRSMCGWTGNPNALASPIRARVLRKPAGVIGASRSD
jgi:microcystin degradation protein MlrC